MKLNGTDSGECECERIFALETKLNRPQCNVVCQRNNVKWAQKKKIYGYVWNELNLGPLNFGVEFHCIFVVCVRNGLLFEVQL